METYTVVKKERKYYKWMDWEQPVMTSNDSFGKVSASSIYDVAHSAFCALDGVTGTGHSNYWVSARYVYSGWWKWELPYKIKIKSILFYNTWAGTNDYTKDAQFFTNSDKSVPLGSSFVARKGNWLTSNIVVDDVVTDSVYLDISSSYNEYIGAGEIEITAEYPVEVTENDDWDYYENVLVFSSPFVGDVSCSFIKGVV